MIGEFVLNIVFNIVSGFLGLCPDITWSIDTSAFQILGDVLSVAGYLLPMGTVVLIFDLVVALTLFRIAISFGRTLWDLLPFA